jgi:predicted metal-dependent hydrolase
MTAIPYTLRRSQRKTLGIRVRPDASVEVTAPAGATLAMIDGVLQRKARWIVRKQAEVRAGPPVPAARYVNGEAHPHLGREYLLDVAYGSTPTVRLDGAHLCVQTPDPASPRATAAALTTWRRQEAAKVFAEELKAAADRVRPLGIVAPPAVRIRQMQTRWGSCTSKGSITLNLRLIGANRELIEYVLVHELCHLAEHNHSKAYYRLLDRALPDWRARKQRLNAAHLP